MYTEGNW